MNPTRPVLAAGRFLRRFWLSVIVAAIGLAGGIGWLVPTNDFLIMPGDAVNTASLVTVPNTSPAQKSGALYLVTVYSAPANFDEWLFGHVYPHARLAPAHTQLPPNTSFDEFQRQEARMMTDSQTVAKVVAFRQLGYTVVMHGKGAIVTQVTPGSPASQAGLKRGDTITGMDGQAVETAEDLASKLQATRPNTQVKLAVMGQDGHAVEREVRVGQRSDNPSQGFLGVSLATDRPTYDFPIAVDINSRGIIGPSGGLVLTLQIMQALSPADITHGASVAATGTMQLNGQIGAIGDVEEKVIAAAGKARYFLVPKDNFAAANQAAAGQIKVVQVDTIQQATAFLQTLGAQPA